MLFLPLTLASAAENLAVDEALLLEAEAGGGDVLRLWEWPSPVVVLGAACRLADDVNAAACARDRLPILRRASGGGTVLLSRGCLCYSLVLSYDRDLALREVKSSYELILGRVADALGRLVPGIAPAGTSDLAWQDRKFSGNSQQRKRHHLLHHGTVLYDFDAGLAERYLRLPDRQPEYRRQRGHDDFLTSIPIAAAALSEGLREAFGALAAPLDWSSDRVTRLVAEKYTSAEWIQRR